MQIALISAQKWSFVHFHQISKSSMKSKNIKKGEPLIRLTPSLSLLKLIIRDP